MSDAAETRTPKVARATPELREKLRGIWETKPGLYGWLGTVDHKEIGIRYLVTSFAFLLLGGLEALAMRVQLAQPDQSILTPEQYDQLFSIHGITMIFLYALPILSGFSNYLFPLLLGARDMAFPRLNAFSYWVFLAAGLFIYASFLAGAVPNDGWFNYAPYSLKKFNPGMNMDFYALGMIFLGISTTVGSVNFLVTLLRLRAPGMSISRLPIMVWGTTTASVGNLLAVPAVSLAFFLLWMDRQFGTHFYETTGEGRPLLWQHLFWIFAHPWVYVIVLPAMGIVSDGLPVFCRRPLVGHALVVLATITTMILGFGVWVHHMFATGIPFMSLSFFSGASFIITIPSAVSVFAWTATIWLGRPVIRVPFLYFASFIVMFVIGGVSGVATAAVPADLQLHGTYFVVAHLHYVLIGINMFGVLGGLYFWFPKFTGKMMDETLGKWAFWFVFIGFNAAFLPMHWTGLMGMPRRIYTYPEGAGWSAVNMLTTIGSFVLAFGVLLVLVNVWQGLRRGAPAGPNPWDAPTLEWSTESPTPPYNFDVIPVVASRHPLWEDRLDPDGPRSSIREGLVLDQGKETVLTSVLDAEPDVIAKMPDDSLWPFVTTLALSVFFGALLVGALWLAGLVSVALLICLVFWLWPGSEPSPIRSQTLVKMLGWKPVGATLGVLLSAAAVFWITAPYPIAASIPHLPGVGWLLHNYMQNSVRNRSVLVKPPAYMDMKSDAMLRLGAGHYATACATCHGSPDQPRNPMVKEMEPAPPDIAEVRKMWGAEYHYIVYNGIKYTGMPAWSGKGRSDEPWALAAFLKKYESLDAETYRKLAFGEAAAAVPKGPQAQSFGSLSGPVGEIDDTCARCHGKDGRGRDGTAPILAGQSEAYLRAALDAYADDHRQSGFMEPVAAALTPEQRDSLAAHYAGMPGLPAAPPEADAQAMTRGVQLVTQGDKVRDIPACNSCHGDKREKGEPIVAGQDAHWLEVWLHVWRDGPNPALGEAKGREMHLAARNMTDEDIHAVAEYLSGKPIPPSARNDTGKEDAR